MRLGQWNSGKRERSLVCSIRPWCIWSTFMQQHSKSLEGEGSARHLHQRAGPFPRRECNAGGGFSSSPLLARELANLGMLEEGLPERDGANADDPFHRTVGEIGRPRVVADPRQIRHVVHLQRRKGLDSRLVPTASSWCRRSKRRRRAPPHHEEFRALEEVRVRKVLARAEEVEDERRPGHSQPRGGTGGWARARAAVGRSPPRTHPIMQSS